MQHRLDHDAVIPAVDPMLCFSGIGPLKAAGAVPYNLRPDPKNVVIPCRLALKLDNTSIPQAAGLYSSVFCGAWALRFSDEDSSGRAWSKVNMKK